MRKLILLLLLSLLPTATFADELWSLTQKGKKALKQENYEEAYDIFSDAVAVDPSSSAAQYNKALALTHLGRGEEALPILDSLVFEDKKLQSEVAYTEANIYEQAGDAAAQKQDVANAKKAYQAALQKNAESYMLNPKNSDARYNLETVGQKLAQLPDNPQDQNQDNKDNQDKNKDNQDKDKNNKDDQQKQDQNKNDDSQDDQNQKDDQKNDQKENQDQQDKGDENKDQQDQDDQKNDQQDNKDQDDKDDQKPQDQDQNEDEQKEDEQDSQGQSPEEQQAEQEMQNALQQIMQYADDAKDLNKPPTKKVRAVSNGKEW